MGAYMAPFAFLAPSIPGFEPEESEKMGRPVARRDTGTPQRSEGGPKGGDNVAVIPPSPPDSSKGAQVAPFARLAPEASGFEPEG